MKTFHASLTAHPDLVSRITVTRRGAQPQGSNDSPEVFVSDNFGTERYPIVRRRAAPTWMELERATFNMCAWSPSKPVKMDNSEWRCEAVGRTRPLEFWVAAREWDGGERVAGIIEELAIEAGWGRVFVEGGVGREG